MTDETLLYRHVNPSWLQDSRPTSQTFRPTPKDAGKLSVYDGDQIDAQRAFIHFTVDLGLAAVGTLAVSVSECTNQALDPQADPAPFPEHCSIDMRGLSRKELERKAVNLTLAARARGWQYQPVPI